MSILGLSACKASIKAWFAFRQRASEYAKCVSESGNIPTEIDFVASKIRGIVFMRVRVCVCVYVCVCKYLSLPRLTGECALVGIFS